MSKRGVYYTKSPLLASRTPVWRSRFVIFCLAFGFIVLITRAAWVQLFEYGHLQQEASKRYERTLSLPANRGEIKDRNGLTLASSFEVPSLWWSPSEVAERNGVELDEKIDQLARLLNMKAGELKTSLRAGAEKEREFAWLKRMAGDEVTDKVMALGIKGLHIQNEYQRNYPARQATAHIIGYTNIDDQGQGGVEYALNQVLVGKPGYVKYVKDRVGNSVAATNQREMPVNGKNVQLSIDRRIQYFAYDALEAAVKSLNAKSGSAVVIDVETGELLSLANYPSYDPVDRGSLGGDKMRNRAVTDVFEPGSTIKPIVMAKALDLGIVKPDTLINTKKGSLVISGSTIRDVGNYSELTAEQVIQKSSNIGIVRIAMNMSAQSLWEAFTGVGFGQRVGIGFPGEAQGKLRAYTSWRPIEQATQSYGYGLSVSLLQLTHAYTALARDGDIIPVTLLRNDNPVKGIPVFSAQAARQAREMMHMATQDNQPGRRAQVVGYTVAGKSGTAKQVGAHGYEERYSAWYVGMAPVDKPRLVVGILIDDPKKDKEHGGYYGGVAAAPVFSDIMGNALRLLGVFPNVSSNALMASTGKGGAA